MGVMRHPFRGSFPDGQADMSFPSVHRNLKTKMYEVLRAVRWHRIAPSFAVDKREVQISSYDLTDQWRFVDRKSEIEEWWFSNPLVGERLSGDTVTVTAPAVISRNCELPCVELDEEGEMPYVLASRNPQGAFSIVSLGRTKDRRYWIPRCRISVNIGKSTIVGIFGEYGELILHTNDKHIARVLAQDLASDQALDITDEVYLVKNRIVIPGTLIRTVGTSAQPEDDTSEPGLVLQIIHS